MTNSELTLLLRTQDIGWCPDFRQDDTNPDNYEDADDDDEREYGERTRENQERLVELGILEPCFVNRATEEPIVVPHKHGCFLCLSHRGKILVNNVLSHATKLEKGNGHASARLDD